MRRLTRYIHKPPDSFEDAVKIEVLDTGIDLNHPTIKGAVNMRRIKTGKSFVKDDRTPQDESGHGTNVASLILKVAPESELLSCKNSQKREYSIRSRYCWGEL